jgi:hypothetical protein
MKRLVCLFSICFLLYSVPAFGAAVEGAWNITGKWSMKGGLSKYGSFNFNLLKNKEIKDVFILDNGECYSNGLGMIGQYALDSKGRAHVDIDTLLQAIEAQLALEFGEIPTMKYNKKSFVIRAIGNDKISGSFILNMEIAVKIHEHNELFTLQLSYLFDGPRETKTKLSPGQAAEPGKLISDFIIEKGVRPLQKALSSTR